MGFDRVGAKLSARESMRLNRPSPLLVTLVYFLLTSVLAAVLAYLVYDPASELLQYLSLGYQPEEILDFILRQHGQDLLLFGALQLLLSLYTVFMSFGYTSYSLRMARNEQPGLGHLFDGFARPGRVLWAAILVSIFTFLWSLLVMLPVIAILVVMVVMEADAALLMGVYFALVAAAMVAVVAISYRYSLTNYFIIDDPDCTARQAVRRSKETMRGKKWTLFVLDLSFFGWALLSAVLSAVISLLLPMAVEDVLCFWVLPYRMATIANFYDWATGASAPGGSPAGPRYDGWDAPGPQSV